MEQIYFGSQILIMGFSVTEWNIYFGEDKASLWAVLSMDGTYIFWRSKLDYGL